MLYAFSDPYMSNKIYNTFVLAEISPMAVKLGHFKKELWGLILGKAHRTRLKLRTTMSLIVGTEQT